jgi:hypothetical protein
LFLSTVLCSLSFEDRILEERTGIRRAPDRLEEDRAPLDKGRCEAAWEADWDIDIPGASSLTIFPEIFEVETSGYHDNIDYMCDFDWLSVRWELEQERYYSYKFCSLDMPQYSRVQNPLR